MALRFTTTGAPFAADLYKLRIRGPIAALGIGGAEVTRHGRVKLIQTSQPGSDLANGRAVWALYWIPAASVVSRGDGPAMLARTIAARAPGVELLDAARANVSPGALDVLREASVDNFATLERLSVRTTAERLASSVDSVQRTAGAAVDRAVGAVEGAVDSVGDRIEDAQQTASNVATYLKLAAAIAGGFVLVLAVRTVRGQ